MKYKLTEETKDFLGHKLHRIVCVTAFASVSVGDIGGWVESESNLSQEGHAWVYGNAKVYGNAEVYGNAKVYGGAKVFGGAFVYGNAEVYGNAKVYGNAEVFGNALVCGDAEVCEITDFIVLKNSWSSGRYFTYRSEERRVGKECRS